MYLCACAYVLAMLIRYIFANAKTHDHLNIRYFRHLLKDGTIENRTVPQPRNNKKQKKNLSKGTKQPFNKF